MDERLQVALIVHGDTGPQFRRGIVGGHIGLGMDAVRGLLDHGQPGEGLGDSGAGVGQLLAVTGIDGRGGRGRWGGARGQPQRGNEEQGFRIHEPGIPPVRGAH